MQLDVPGCYKRSLPTALDQQRHAMMLDVECGPTLAWRSLPIACGWSAADHAGNCLCCRAMHRASSTERGERVKQKTAAKRFAVQVSLDNVLLAKAGSAMTLHIVSRGEKLGELQIGRGSLFWWGANRKTSQRVSWSKFAEMMNRLAYGE